MKLMLQRNSHLLEGTMRNAAFAFVAASVLAAGTMIAAPTPASARCFGCAVGAGIAVGVIGSVIGGAIANSERQHEYWEHHEHWRHRAYYDDDYYEEPSVRYVPPDDAIDYCMRRFKSYDPRSGTYVGYDGYRHACP